MSVDRILRAGRIEDGMVEAFPYFSAQFTMPLDDDEDDDDPLASHLSTPEEDAQRLASVDQIIFEKRQEAEREAQETARRGYEEGFASGELEGRTFGESQYKAHIQRLDGHLEAISQSLALNLRASTDEILALALALGEYLAGRAIEGGATTIGPLLEGILDAHPFPGAANDGPETLAMTVHLHPRDLEELGTASQFHPGVTLREDPDLSRGGLRLEAAIGVLDASLERRKAKAVELIQAYREKATP
jgi:flagellar biosynthesis/type III secretory pathway protein FliH